MINLLPTEFKQSIIYARRNRVLLRWIVALMFLLVGVATITFFGQLYIDRSINAQTTKAEQTREQLKTQRLAETQTQVEDISSSIKLALQVLSREVLFSKLLRQIGAAMPEGATLSGIGIEKVEGGIDLQAVATDYRSASQVQVNLQDPNNRIFDKADIVNISCKDEEGEAKSQYPCVVNIRALFGDNSPFLFIGNDKKNAGAKP